MEVGWVIENPLAINAKQTSEISIDFDRKGNELKYRVFDPRKQILSSGSILKASSTSSPDQIDIREHKELIKRKPNDNFIYKTLRRFGFSHGPMYQIVRKGLYSSDECFAEVNLTERHFALSEGIDIHPIVIDSMLQCCCSFLPFFDIPTNAKLFPVGIGSLCIKQKVTAKMYIYSRVLKNDNANFLCNALLLQESGVVVAEMLNIRTRILNIPLNVQELSLCYSWEKLQLSEVSQTNQKNDILIITRRRNTRDLLSGKIFRNIICLDDNVPFDIVKNTILSKSPKVLVYIPGRLDKWIGTQQTYNDILSDGKFLLQLTKTFSNVEAKIVIITEATQSMNFEHQRVNLLGSELWGMTRSIAMEPTKLSFHLVDTYPNVEQNIESLTSLLMRMSNEEMPFESSIINGEFFYGCVQRILPEIKSRKESNRKVSGCKPLSEFSGVSLMQTQNKQMVAVSVSSACRNLFEELESQNALPKASQLWTTGDGIQYGMKCVEFIGTSDENHDEKKEIICCWPCKLQPEIVVPKPFVCPKDEIPNYSLGMFQTCIFALTIADCVVDTKTVITIVDDYFEGVANFLEQFLDERKVKMYRRFDFENDNLSRSRKVCLILLSSAENVELNFNPRDTYSKVVCIDKNFQSMYNDNEAFELVFLSLEDIFSQRNISRNINGAKRYLKMLSRRQKPSKTFERNSGELIKDSLIMHSEPTRGIPLVKANSSYIVVGGLTGLGWLLVKHLARNRARKIIVFSRRVPDNEIMLKIQRLNNFYGVNIVTVKVDICNLQNLLQVFYSLKSLCKNQPIRGIFHGAAVTADKFSSDMTMDQFEIPLRPKILGTLNLHQASNDLTLDYFVTHSSVAALIGNVGQCNYAAGNSFQDCFALYRRSKGLSATSIIWGALDTGLAADQVTRESLRSRGFISLKQQQILECIDLAIWSGDVYGIFAHIDWRTFLQDDIKSQRIKFKEFLNQSVSSITHKTEKCDDPEQFDDENIKKMVLECLASVFALHLSQLSFETPIVEYGLDSQKGTELASLIFDRCNVRVPYIFLATDDHSAEDVVQFVKNRREMNMSDDKGGTSTFVDTRHFSVENFIEDVLVAETYVVYHEVHMVIKNAKVEPFLIQNALQFLAHLHPELRTFYNTSTDKEGKVYLKKTEKEEEDAVLNIEIKNSSSFDDRINVRDVKSEPVKVEILRHNRDIKIIFMFCPLLFDTCSIVRIIEESRDLMRYCESRIETPSYLQRFREQIQTPNLNDFLSTDSEQTINFWRSELSRQTESIFTHSNQNSHAVKRTSIQIPDRIAGTLFEKLDTRGIGRFQVVCFFTQLSLANLTKSSAVTVLAQTDLRSVVGFNEQDVGMLSNLIPFISDFSQCSTIGLNEFLSKNVQKLKSMEETCTLPFHQIKTLEEFDESKHLNLACMFLDETVLKKSTHSMQIKEYRSGFSSMTKAELLIVSSREHITLHLTSTNSLQVNADAILRTILHLLELYVYNDEILMGEILVTDFSMGKHDALKGQLYSKVPKTQKSVIEPQITNSRKNGQLLDLGSTRVPLHNILSVSVSEKDERILVIRTKKKDIPLYADNTNTCQMWKTFLNSKLKQHKQGLKWKGSQSSLFQFGTDVLVEDQSTHL